MQYCIEPSSDEQGPAQGPFLARDSFRVAKRRRVGSSHERPLVLTNCRLLDVRRGTVSSYGHSVVVRGGRIEAVDTQQVPPDDAVIINCSGKLLMPGLCDAHVHVTATTADLAAFYGLAESLVTARSVDILEGMLLRGFTTVRDAGGADWGLAEAVQEGSILGPRILFVGECV
jgi:imidazolonepropionase-like amidohydrolase